MLNFQIDLGLSLFLLFFHCLIGGIAALIAKQKGRSYSRWIMLGLIGGTVAFIAALFLKPEETRPLL